jgi:hypothetical protein
MRFVRKIEEKTREDRIRNSTFRVNLKKKSTLQAVEERRKSWFRTHKQDGR